MRCLPHNLDAEESVLGAILLEPDAIGRVKDVLHPDALFSESHRIIYQTCLDLDNNTMPTDLMSVTMMLLDKNILDTVGGQHKLAQLVERTISATNIELYAKYINEKYEIRKAVSITSNLAQKMNTELNLDLVQTAQILKEQLQEIETAIQLSNTDRYSYNQKLANKIKSTMLIEDPIAQAIAWKKLSKETGIFSELELKKLAYTLESAKPLKPVSCKEFCASILPSRKWLFEGLIPGGSVSLLVAESKTGKSLLAYDLAYYAAHGKTWGDFPMKKAAKTLVLQADEPKADTQTRMILRGMDQLENVHVEHHFGITQFAKLKRMIEEEKYEFVIIDSLIAIARGQNLNDAESSLFLYAMRDLASETGVPILLIHHTNKTGDSSQSKTSLSRIANSYAIAACSSVAFMLTYPDNSTNPNERVLTASGSRVHENQKSWKIELSPEDFSWEYLGECDRKGEIKGIQETRKESETLLRKIVNVLSKRAGNFYSISDIGQLLKEDYNESCSDSTLRSAKYCPSLVASGQVIRVQLSGSKAWHYTINAHKENLSVATDKPQDIMSDPTDFEIKENLTSEGSIDSNEDVLMNAAIDPSDPFLEKDQLMGGDDKQTDNFTLCYESGDRADEKTYTFEIQRNYVANELVFTAHPDYYGGAMILERRLRQNKPIDGRHLWMYKCIGIDDGLEFQVPGEYIYSEDAWNDNLIPKKEDVKYLKL